MVEAPEYTARDIVQLHCKSSLMDFTRYFFKKQNKKTFIVGSHHRRICEKIDALIRGDIKRLIINIAPRYGKTELAVKAFIAYGLSINPSSKFIHLSYSDELALDNSEAVKDLVSTFEYRDVFPDVTIKYGSDAKKKWYTTEGGGVYATAAGGQVTGFGAGQVDEEQDNEDIEEMVPDGHGSLFGGALIIDDPIKPEDADSETKRNRINNRWDSTIKNRVNSRNTPILIIMQRLHEEDLCGYLLANEPGEWEVLSLPCIQTDESGSEYALWPHKHTLQELYDLRDKNDLVFQRQYQQNPTPAGGYLYGKPWKTYQIIPYSQRRQKKAYIDTADLGTDYLCSITYDETEIGCYVTDVIYTQAGMETTEPMVAKQLFEQGTALARFESNNGGRGFARNVESQTRLAGNNTTSVVWFHQSNNKYTRIFTNANTVQNLIYFPEDWETRWPKFAKHVKTYMAAGKNVNDDAEDALTGVVEWFGKDYSYTDLDELSQFG